MQFYLSVTVTFFSSVSYIHLSFFLPHLAQGWAPEHLTFIDRHRLQLDDDG